MPRIDQGLLAALTAAVALTAGLVLAVWLTRRFDRATAGISLIALTPLVPTLRIPLALGLSTDDILPLMGLCLLIVPARWLRAHEDEQNAGKPTAPRWTRLQLSLAAGLALVLVGGVISAILNGTSIPDALALLARGAGRFAFLGLIVWAVGRAIERHPARVTVAGQAMALMGTAEAAFGLFAYVVPLPGHLGLEHARKTTVLFGHVPGRVAGTLGISPDFTGAILMITLIVTVGFVLAAKGRARLWWLAAALLQLATLTLTFSRVPLLLAILGIVALLLLANRPVLLIPVATVGAALALFTPIVTRFVSDSNDRLALWSTGFQVMMDHPVAGVGAGQMLAVMQSNPGRYMQTAFGSAVNNAHNTVVLAGAEMGVIAALGALVLNIGIALMALLAIRHGVTSRPRSELLIAAAIAVLAFLVQGMVNNLFTVGATGPILALLVGAFIWSGNSVVLASEPTVTSSPAEPIPAPERVPLQIVVPVDPDAMPIGGIAAFIRGFVKYAPDEFDLELLGTTTSQRLGAWRDASLEGRAIRHLPVAHSRPRRGRIPLAASFTAGLLWNRRRTRGWRLRQFHRPGTALPLLSHPGPKAEVVHLPASDLVGGDSESHWRRASWLLRAVERFTFSRLDRIYVVNEDAAQAYSKLYPRLSTRIEYVPNWVDDGVFRALDGDERGRAREELRETVGAQTSARLVLFVGRLERQKDPMLAVEACVRLMSADPSVELVIAGDGGMRGSVQQAVEEAELGRRIHVVGAIERSRLAGWMAGADVLLITSHLETGPTVGLEALATGLPVVMTDVGTVARLIRSAGCGTVVDGRDPAVIAAALGSVLAADQSPLQTAAQHAVDAYRASAVLRTLYDDARRLVVQHDRDVKGAHRWIALAAAGVLLIGGVGGWTALGGGPFATHALAPAPGYLQPGSALVRSARARARNRLDVLSRVRDDMHAAIPPTDALVHRRSYRVDPTTVALWTDQHAVSFRAYPPFHVPRDPTWAEDPQSSIAWQADYQSLAWLRAPEQAYQQTHDAVYLSQIHSYVLGWIRSSMAATPPSERTWYDDAVSIRTDMLVELLAGDLWTKLSDHELDIVLGSLEKHGTLLDGYLSDPAFAGSNHNLFHAISLYNLAVAFPDLNHARQWRTDARARISALLPELVDTTEGVSLEGAAAYHYIVLQTYAGADALLGRYSDSLSPQELSVIGSMADFGALLLSPRGDTPAIGDTSYGSTAERSALSDLAGKGIGGDTTRWVLSHGADGVRPPDASFYPNAGYAIVRPDWSAGAAWENDLQLVVSTSDRLQSHGHEDALSFVLNAAGSPLLVDSGGPYLYGNSAHLDFTGPGAHNTVLDLGRTGGRGRVTDLEETDSSGYTVIAGSVALSDGATDRRLIILLKPDLLVVIDRLAPTDHAPHYFQLLYHLPPEASVQPPAVVSEAAGRTTAAGAVQIAAAGLGYRIVASGDMVSAIARGLNKPFLGWVTPGYGVKTPAPVLTFGQQAGDAWFVSAFQPGAQTTSPPSLSVEEDPTGGGLSIHVAGAAIRSSIRLDGSGGFTIEPE